MPEDIRQLIGKLKALRVEEARLIERIESEITPVSPERETYERRDKFEIGDRVFVTNRVRKPLRAPSTWSVEKERRGTVTDIRGQQVHFETENGTKTWRDRSNLRVIVTQST